MPKLEANGIKHNSKKGNSQTRENSVILNGSNNSDDEDDAQCPIQHEGKECLNAVYSFPVDELFKMIFTKNRFIDEVFEDRKITDVVDTEWELDEESGNKERKLDYTLALNSALVKSCHSTDVQTLLKETKPGQLYIIDCEIVNAGVPHSDSFYLKSHYCLTRVSKKQTRIQVFGIVKYKKSLWGMIKSMIEKTCMQNLNDFCSGLENALNSESAKQNDSIDDESEGIVISVPELKQSSQSQTPEAKSTGGQNATAKKPRPKPPPQPRKEAVKSPLQTKAAETGVVSQLGKSAELFIAANIVLLSSLLLLNLLLFYKLWNLEDSSLKNTQNTPTQQMHLPIGSCFSSENLLRLLKDQETTHRDVAMGWKKAFEDLVNLNRMMGESMYNLKQNIESYVNVAVLKNFDLPADMIKDHTGEKKET